MIQNKNVQAIVQKTPQEGNFFKKITEKNWTVYYYLLAISSKNFSENHRYAYRKDFNITQASKELGINRQTFYNSLTTLSKNNMIETYNDYILINIPETYTTITKNLLIQLLSYRKVLSIDLLRTYLFAKVIYDTYKNKEITLRNIVRCLGHSDTTAENYKKVEIYLDLLSNWKLIQYTRDIKKDDKIGSYRIYNFTKVYTESEELQKREINGDMQVNAGLSPEEEEFIKNKINFFK